MKSYKLIFNFFLMIFLISTISYSQTIDEIINKSLKARGNVDSLRNIKSVHFLGKISTAGQEIKMAFIKKLPDKIRFQVEINGRQAVTCFKGDSGWIYDPSQNEEEPTHPKQLSIQEIAQKRPLIQYLMVFFDDLLLNYKDLSIKATNIGIDTINGKAMYKLLFLLKDGTIATYFVDTTSYLDTYHKVLFPDLNIVFEVFLSNFATVSGIRIPLTIESKVKDQQMTKITIETMRINEVIKDEFFDMPKF